MKLKSVIALSTVGLLLSTIAVAADYPKRTIGMMIPFSAGGGTDVPGRFFAVELEKILGKNVVVSNVTGAGGTIGATQLSKAKADGYSLGFMPVGTTTTQPHIRKTSYNDESWEPICLVAQSPQYVVVKDDAPFKTIDDVITKAKDDRLITAGPPPGSLPHLAQAAVAKAYGVKFNYIPHDGINEVAKSMLGGRVDMTVYYADAKERFGLRPLVILDAERSEVFPDVPTLGELGHPVESAVWFGFFAPAGTPEDVVGILSDACGKAVKTDSFVENMEKAKRDVRYLDTSEFRVFFKKQYQQNGELLKEAGLVK